MTNLTFEPWPKTPRWSSESFIITEKIDGTNACIIIGEDGTTLAAQSRTRLITPENDNFGFAMWASKNKEELLKLGPGHHFGEWWGCGIQRGYDMSARVFSLFNTTRWSDSNIRPSCCSVVPVLCAGSVMPTETDNLNITDYINLSVTQLKTQGSCASPGFMRPEGICIYLSRSNQVYKVPFDK